MSAGRIGNAKLSSLALALALVAGCATTRDEARGTDDAVAPRAHVGETGTTAGSGAPTVRAQAPALRIEQRRCDRTAYRERHDREASYQLP